MAENTQRGMGEPVTKRLTTSHDGGEHQESSLYRDMLFEVGENLTSKHVEELACLAGCSVREQDGINRHTGNKSLFLFQLLEKKETLKENNLLWLQNNLVVIHNEMAVTIVNDYISGKDESTADFPNEPCPFSSDDDECNSFQEFLSQLGLQDKFPGKLTLKMFLKVKRVPEKHDYIASFWQQLTSLDYRAGFPDHSVSNRFSMRDFIFSVLHCSDDFVRQDILEKMSACQLAVPIVLNDVDGVLITFLLWALRRITKKWKGLHDSLAIEQPIVSYPLFIVSVLRIGNVRVSKSEVLNTMLSKSQGNASHFYFLSEETDIVKPKFSKGSIECAWFLPMHGNDKQIFREVMAFFNLRGDCKNYPSQRKFACKSSNLTIAFIATEKRGENVELIREIKETSRNFLFVAVKEDESVKRRPQKVYHPTYKYHWLFVRVVQMDVLSRRICDEIMRVCESEDQLSYKCLQNLPELMWGEMQVDEHKSACKTAQRHVINFIKSVNTNDILKFKKSCFPLQDIWKDLVNIEKERFDSENEKHKSFEHQREHILSEIKSKRELQLQTCLSETMRKYYDMIIAGKDNSTFLHYIFGFLQDEIYHIVNVNTKGDFDQILHLEKLIRERTSESSGLRDFSNAVSEMEVRVDQTYQDMKAERSKLYRKCRAQTLGCEHFLRELGQLYEAYKDLRNSQIQTNLDSAEVVLLPEVAADLVNEMHSLEILDGDTASVPLAWVTSVLDTLTQKLGDPKVLVLSVIGVQSSGKSTFLNSMFGVRFPVRAGRCTRGLFIRFLQIEEKLAEELGCEYLIVVDTEGIKSLDHDDRRFDNELVTLALSIANVTIFNIEGENIGPDMTGILQIAAHALIRMKEVDLECHCRIVQQRVSDLTAGDRNKANTDKIMELLDDATKIAAEEEGLEGRYRFFSDVVDLRVDEDLQYIPSLWVGGMSPPNHLYSDTVTKIKAQVFKDVSEGRIVSDFTLSTFTQRVIDVWKAVKEEDFVFNFKDSVRAVDFNQFCLEYNKWIAETRMFMVTCINDLLYRIDNKLTDETNEELDIGELKETLCNKVTSQRHTLTNSVKNYIENHVRRHTIQKHEQLFLDEAGFVLKDIENNALAVLTDEYELQKVKSTKNLTKFKAKWRQRFSVEARKVASVMLGKEKACIDYHNLFETHWKKWMEMVDKECLGSKMQMTFSSLHTVCEKLLVRITRDMAVGSEIKTLMTLEGGIDKHKDLPGDCSNYIHTKFVKSWIRQTLLSKGRSGSDVNTQTEEQLILEGRKEAVDFVSRVIESQFEKMKVKQSRKPFDDNIYQLMLQSTLDQLSGKHINFKPPHTLIAKSLLCISGKSLEWLHQNEALHGNINYSALLEEEKDMAFTDFVASFCSGNNDASRAAEVLYDQIAPFITRKFQMQLRKLNYHEDAAIRTSEMPWDALQFIVKTSSGSICDLLENIFLDSSKLCYLIAKEQRNERINAIKCGAKIKANNLVSELIKKLEKCERESNTVWDWCSMLHSELEVDCNPYLTLFSEMSGITDVSTQLKNIITTKLSTNLMEQLSSRRNDGRLVRLFTYGYYPLCKNRSSRCPEVCPMCNAPCDNALHYHNSNHFSQLHRPRGFKGATYSDTNKLIIEDCSSSVLCKKSTFKYQKRTYLCHQYRDVVPDWTIHPSKDDPGKVFWQWLLVMSNNYMASLYECNPADIPQCWYSITKEEALISLEEDKHLKTRRQFRLQSKYFSRKRLLQEKMAL